MAAGACIDGNCPTCGSSRLVFREGEEVGGERDERRVEYYVECEDCHEKFDITDLFQEEATER